MIKNPPDNQYFKPVDKVAETLIRMLDEVPDQEIREYRRYFLENYHHSQPASQKQKEWKQILSQPAFKSLTLPPAPHYHLIDSEIMPGGGNEYAGVVDFEQAHIRYWIHKDYRSLNVHFCHFDQALRDHLIPDVQLDRLKAAEGGDRFTLLSQGAANHSLCLVIPDDVRIEKPFLVKVNEGQPSTFIPFLINLFIGKRASASIILEEQTLAGNKGQSLVSMALNAYSDEDSSLDVMENQLFSHQVQLFSSGSFTLSTSASLNYFLIERGSKSIKRNVRVRLDGQDSSAVMSGVYKPAGKQIFVFDTHQDHLASRTTSDLLFKGILDEEAYSLWKGNVLVAKGTRGVDGFQMNNNLLLSPASHAESIPGLEISADDVKCSHGVTMGDLDPEQLFYLETRGMNRAIATKLIVDGYMADALRRIRSHGLRRYATETLDLAGE